MWQRGREALSCVTASPLSDDPGAYACSQPDDLRKCQPSGRHTCSLPALLSDQERGGRDESGCLEQVLAAELARGQSFCQVLFVASRRSGCGLRELCWWLQLVSDQGFSEGERRLAKADTLLGVGCLRGAFASAQM